MTTSDLPPSDDPELEADDTRPPEHPAGSDTPVSAGEALSAEGIGAGGLAPPGQGADVSDTREQELDADT